MAGEAADAVSGWCGHCGTSLAISVLLTPGAVGRCPACGAEFAPGYAPVLAGTLTELLRAHAAWREASDRIAELAPHLHVRGGAGDPAGAESAKRG